MQTHAHMFVVHVELQIFHGQKVNEYSALCSKAAIMSAPPSADNCVVISDGFPEDPSLCLPYDRALQKVPRRRGTRQSKQSASIETRKGSFYSSKELLLSKQGNYSIQTGTRFYLNKGASI